MRVGGEPWKTTVGTPLPNGRLAGVGQRRCFGLCRGVMRCACDALRHKIGQVARGACCPPHKPDASPTRDRPVEFKFAITTWTHLLNVTRAEHSADFFHLVPCERPTISGFPRHSTAIIVGIGFCSHTPSLCQAANGGRQPSMMLTSTSPVLSDGAVSSPSALGSRATHRWMVCGHETLRTAPFPVACHPWRECALGICLPRPGQRDWFL